MANKKSLIPGTDKLLYTLFYLSSLLYDIQLALNRCSDFSAT